jgi:hypothetical protein
MSAAVKVRPRVRASARLARSRRLFYRRARRRAWFSSSRASMETTRCDATRSTPSSRSIDRSIAMDDRRSIGVRSRPLRETISALERDD